MYPVSGEVTVDDDGDVTGIVLGDLVDDGVVAGDDD